MPSIYLAFLTGLTTGGLSCMAIQGGLLTTALSQKTDDSPNKWSFIGLFLSFKLVSHAILGFLLGSFGSLLAFSVQSQGWLQIAIGLFMLATVGRILNLHPVFRYFAIQPPAWLYRRLRKNSRHANLMTPAFLGAMTVFMPCGVTQAMMVVSVGSGSGLLGAGILSAFVLGTSPIFIALGVAASRLLSSKKFEYIAAAVILVFAILSVNGGLALTGSIYTLQNFSKVAFGSSSIPSAGKIAGVNDQGVQETEITVSSGGYSSPTRSLRVGVPVRLTLTSQNVSGCARAFTIPSLNISKVLPQSGKVSIEFTPTKSGRLAFSCSMGMFTGSFTII